MDYVFYSSSLFTNSNWFTFDGDRGINDRLAASVPSSSPNSEETCLNVEVSEEVEVLTGEAPGTELQLESVHLENGPAEEIKEISVAKHSDARTDEENSSKEPEATEQPVDPQEEQVDTQGGDGAEVSSEETVTDRTVDEPASTSEPDIASANSVDIDNQSATLTVSSEGLQLEGEMEHDSGKGLQLEGDLSVEVDQEATAKE